MEAPGSGAATSVEPGVKMALGSVDTAAGLGAIPAVGSGVVHGEGNEEAMSNGERGECSGNCSPNDDNGTGGSVETSGQRVRSDSGRGGRSGRSGRLRTRR
jgi:hypothetical protein